MPKHSKPCKNNTLWEAPGRVPLSVSLVPNQTPGHQMHRQRTDPESDPQPVRVPVGPGSQPDRGSMNHVSLPLFVCRGSVAPPTGRFRLGRASPAGREALIACSTTCRSPSDAMDMKDVTSRSNHPPRNPFVSSTAEVSRRACFLCGETNWPLTEEHIWTRWISGLLCGRKNSFDHHFRHVRTTGDTNTSKWTSRHLRVTTKTICSDCNCRWLSGFENRVAPIVSPLIIGEDEVALAPESRALLAAWAYKMAMLLEVSHPNASAEFFTPVDERLRFRQTASVPPRVRVFVGSYDFAQRLAHATILRQTFAERTFYLQLATLTAGHLAMQVMSVRSVASNNLVSAEQMNCEFRGPARETVVRIWPPVPGCLEWPPARTMSHQDVDDVASMRIEAPQLAGTRLRPKLL